MAITPLQSRIEEILSGSKTITPQSRIEVLLIELIEAIEESGEASAYHYKGSVNSVNDLPESAEVGDVYNVIATGMNYAWTGTEWDALGWLVEVISNIIENSQSPVTSAAIYSALAGKVNTEQGKGLSTNDFTNTDKENLATALEKANAAAPQATTYTKGQVDAALAAKLNTADVDAALSSTSTNPVQNNVVRAPIARLVDAGAKNIADMSKTSFTSLTKGGVTVTLSGDTFTSFGTSTSDANVFFNVFYVDLSTVLIPSGKWVAVLEGTGIENFRVEEFDSYNEAVLKGEFGKPFRFEIHTGVTVSYVRITTKPNALCDGNFRLMICKEEDYEISQEFVPYAPSNRELYEEVETKATVYDIFGTSNQINSGDNLDDYITPGAYVSSTNSISQSLTNCPVMVAFRLEILQVANIDRFCQFIYPNGEGTFYIRNRLSGRWSVWYKFEGTAVT